MRLAHVSDRSIVPLENVHREFFHVLTGPADIYVRGQTLQLHSKGVPHERQLPVHAD